MSNLEKYIKMLRSDKSVVRYEACEELRVATDSSPEVILALKEATKDPDAQVAERAIKALNAAVHQHMAIRMRINKPEIQANAINQSEPPRSSGETQIPSGKTKICPYCAETIKFEAIVCRYCGRPMPGRESDVPPMAQVSPQIKTNQQKADSLKASDGEENWEYCQIQAFWKDVSRESCLGFLMIAYDMKYECYFWADAIGKNGTYCAATSPKYRITGRVYRWEVSNPPMGLKEEDTTVSGKILSDLVNTLINDGWQMLSERGTAVWQYKFKRKLIA